MKALREGEAAAIHGAQASLTMLMLDDILTNPKFTIKETQTEGEDDDDSWFSYSASASVSGSALWRTERNAEGVTRTHTLTGTGELAANFTIAPEGVMSKVRTGADKLSDMGAAFAGDAADAIEKHNAFDARPLSNSSSRAPSRRGSTAPSQVPRSCGSSIRRTRPPSRGCSRSRASPRLRDA